MWVLVLALLVAAAGDANAGQAQRLPRQTFTNAAAITGIVTTQDGLGLGGVAIVLQNVVFQNSETQRDPTTIKPQETNPFSAWCRKIGMRTGAIRWRASFCPYTR